MSSSDKLRPDEFKPELYDEIPAGYYDDVYRRGRGLQWFWHHYRFLAVAALIPTTGRRILDVGCGPGTFLAHFATGYEQALGIDLAQPQIAYAKQKYGSNRLRFEAADIAAFRDAGPFDAIVSIEVVEHLPAGETQQFLRSLYNMLANGGTLVLTTPNYRSFWPAIEWVISKKGPVDYLEQHITHFNVPRLARELEKAGFAVETKRTFFVIAPFVAAISRKAGEIVYAIERRLLPRFGSEIVISAKKTAV